MLFKLCNFAAFQIAWPLTVLSAAKGYPLVGVACTAMWVPLHIMFLKHNKYKEAKLLLSTIAIAILFESLLIFTASVAYPEQAQLGLPVPLWIIALWVNVALTLNHCLNWINKYSFLAPVLGMIFGPLAYSAGMRLGAISFDPIIGNIIIGTMWAIAMPLLIRINRLVISQSNLARLHGIGF